MTSRRVNDVMTTEVAVVREGTPFKRVAAVMAEHGVSGLPVLDADGRVVGVVSEADLLYKEEDQDGGGLPAALAGRRARAARAKAAADTAGEAMSSPAVTIGPDATVGQAARLLVHRGVKRLPVVDDAGTLVGIVSRHDLLSVFLRSDTDIQAEIERELVAGVFMAEPGAVRVTVRDGVALLEGQLEQKSLVPIMVRLTHGVDGVVDVVDKLTYALDDTVISPVVESPIHGVIRGRPHP
jgi:CBS domain-containing protein